MNVETIMTREVKTCRPNDTLDTPTRLMWDMRAVTRLA